MKRAFALALVALAAACRRAPEKPKRTEPWLASSASAAARNTGRARYDVESGSVSVDLSTPTHQLQGTLERVEGFVDFDEHEPRSTRATLRADLLSLQLSSGSDAGDDAALLARAFDWLELSPSRPERREQCRWAELSVTATTGRGEPAGRRGPATAHGELTLHGFRVPVEVELEVSLEGDADAPPVALEARTRKPWLIPLDAHDILPRRADGSLVEADLPLLGKEIGRRAKVSAQIRAKRVAAPASGPKIGN